MTILISGAVLVATFIQIVTSAKDAGHARREAMDWWQAEDELVEKQRWTWNKVRARRELRKMRDPQIHQDIHHLWLVLVSWTILTAASGAAFVMAIINA